MVYLLNKTIKNILSNYISRETITCNDREPHWINNKNKQVIQEINNTLQKVSGKLSPRKLPPPPQKIGPYENTPVWIFPPPVKIATQNPPPPEKIAPWKNSPQGKLPPMRSPPHL